MESAVLVILLALAQFTYFSVRVGALRTKYGVNAPRTSGDESWALLLGVLFLLGRQLYSYEYLSNPASRVPGMAMTFLANGILLAGGLIGVFLKIF